MKVLYIAYSCSPSYGSEDAIGWNIPIHFVQMMDSNQAYIVTKSEHKDEIETWCNEHPNISNRLKFYYITIKPNIKFWAKGPLYSFRIIDFFKQAVNVVNKLCEEEQIRVMHQITPVEFRTIGMFDCVKQDKVQYIVGPIAGAQRISRPLMKYVDNKLIEIIRVLVNESTLQNRKYKRKFQKVSIAMFANRETADEFLKHKIIDTTIVLPEVGVFDQGNIRVKHDVFTFLMVGRLISIKGFRIVLESMKNIDRDDYKLVICGKGPLEKKLQKLVEKYHLENNVEFRGFVSYADMDEQYKKSDVLIMPSLREATGTVLVEAMNHGVPVITFNKFGAREIIDENCSWTISEDDPINSLKLIMESILNNKQMAIKKGDIAHEKVGSMKWNNKVVNYIRLYNKMLDSNV